MIEINDDAAAADIYTKIDSTTGDERQQMADALITYGEKKAKEEYNQADDHFSNLFLDEKYYNEQVNTPDLQQAYEATPFPKEAAKRAVLQGYLQHASGAPVSADTYEFIRDSYAQAKFGKTTVSDDEMFGLVRGEYDWQKQRTEAINDLQMQAVGKAITDSQLGQTRPFVDGMTEVFNQWQQKYPELVDGKNDAAFLSQGYKLYYDTINDLDTVRPQASKALSTLTSFTQGNASDEDMQSLANDFVSAPPEDRQKIYKYVTLAAQAGQIDRSGIDQFAINMGQAFTRGFDFVPQGSLQLQEAEVGDMLNGIRNGQKVWVPKTGDVTKAVVRDTPPQAQTMIGGPSSLAVNAAQTDQTGDWREATVDETEKLIQTGRNLQESFKVVRELRNVAKTGVDPIRPVLEENSFWGTAERGAYGLAGSLPLMGATAVNPFLGALAYQSTEYDRIMLENPDINPKFAQGLALVEGVANAATDRLEIANISGRLPMFGRWLDRVSSDGVRRTAKIAGSIAFENLQEAGQDLIAPILEAPISALRDDMPDQNFTKLMDDWSGQRAETFFATLPLALIGGGVATYQDIKNPSAELNATKLRMAGFGKDQVTFIQRAENPEEYDARIQMEWEKRTPENIEAGRQEVIAEMEKAATPDENSAKLSETVAEDGTRRWTVTTPDGKELLQTQDQQAALDAIAQHGNAQLLNDQFKALYEPVELRQMITDLSTQWTSQDSNNTLVMESQGMNAQQKLEQLQAAGNAAQIQELHNRIANSPMKDTPYDQINILGEASVDDVAEMVFKPLITINPNTRPENLREEIHHIGVKVALKNGSVTLDTLRGWLDATEKALPNIFPNLVRDTEGDIVESLAQVQAAYEDGKIDANEASNLPASFIDYIKNMMRTFAEVLRRAVALRGAFKDGALPAEYETFLADSVGLNQQARVDTASNRVSNDIITDGGQMLMDFSIGSRTNAVSTDTPSIRASNATITGPANYSIGKKQDADYLAAVERGDMQAAQKMADDAAKSAGYLPHGDFRDSHTAPSGPAGTDEEVKNGDADASLVQVARGVHIQPDDYFDPRVGPQYYSYKDKAGMEAFNAIRAAMDKIQQGKKAFVTVFRAVPNDIKGAKLENRDWVTPSKTYAVNHGESRFGEGEYRIINESVPAETLFWDGNDIREWGKDDGKNYTYKNTKNNRKLIDPVTYDDAGNVIPLSQRFNPRSADINYSIGFAPNGKPSNLTPDEQALTQSPEFKNWSGNLEVSEINKKVVSVVDVDDKVLAGKTIKDLRKNALQKTKSWWGTRELNDDLEADVLINRDTIEHMLSNFGAVQIHASLFVPQIVRSARKISDEPHNPEIPEVVRVHRLLAAIRFRGDILPVEVVVKEHRGPKQHHAYDIEAITVKTETAEQVLPGGTDKELRTGSAAVSEIKVQDLRRVVNPESVMVKTDENGEPLASEIARFRQETGTSNYSIASQSEIDRVNRALGGMNRGPDERLKVYERAKQKFSKLMAWNSDELASMADTGSDDSQIRRTQILQGLGELDGILSVLPPEVRGRVGGYTKLAGIAPHDVFKDGVQVSEVSGMNGAIISAWMREGQNIGQAGKQVSLPLGYKATENLSTKRADKAIADFFRDRIKKIDTELEKVLVREYTEAITKVVKQSRPKAGDNGVRKSTLGAETQKFADMVQRATLLDDEATPKRMAAIEAELANPDATAEDISALSEEWSILNTFGDLDNRSSETLAQGLDWLKGQLQMGREAWRIKEQARIDEQRARAAATIEWLGKGTAKKRFADKGLMQRIAEVGNNYLLDHASFEQFVTAMLPPEIAANFSERLRKADMAAQSSEIRDGKGILDAVRQGAKAANMSAGDAMLWLKGDQKNAVAYLEGRKVKDERIAIDLAQKIVTGEADRSKLTDADIETLRNELAALPADTQKEYVTIKRVIFRGEDVKLDMSRAKAIQLLLSWNQPDVQIKMRKEGWTDESAADLKSLVNDHVSRSVVSYLQSLYGKGAGIVNPVYSRMFGMNMPQVKNYAPTRFLNAKDTPDINLDGSPTATGTTPSFAKSRVTHSAKIAPEDALTVAQGYIAQQAHWVHFAELAREFRALLSSPDVRESLKQAHGDAVLKSAELWADQLEQRGGNKARESAWLNNVIGTAISGKAVASLGFNLKTLAMQLENSIRFGLSLDMKQIASALSQPGNIIEDIQTVWESDAIQNRLQGGATAEARFLFSRYAGKPNFAAKIAEASMTPINWLDSAGTSISSAIVYRANLNDALASGMPENLAKQAALNAASEAIYRFAQPVSFGQKSIMENNGNVFAKTFFLFMSDPRLKTAILADAARGLATGRGNASEHIRRIVAVELMALVSHVIASAFKDAFSGDDDEEIWGIGGFAKAMLLAPFQGFFFAGSVAEVALSKLTGQGYFTSSQNPLLNTAESAIRAGSNLDDAFNFSDPEAMLKQWNNIFRSMAVTPTMAAPAVLLNMVKPVVGLYQNATTEE